MIEEIKKIYLLKEKLESNNKIKIELENFSKASFQNMTQLEKNIIIKNNFNNRFIFLELVNHLILNNELDLIFDNVDYIINIDVLLQLYMIVDYKKNDELKEKIKKTITNKLDKNELINEYLIDLLLIFCNDNNIDFNYYISNLSSDNYSMNSEFKFCLKNPKELISFFQDSYNKQLNYMLNIFISNKNYIDISNKVHLKNILIYIKNKGISSSRNTDNINKSNLFELLKLENINLLNLFNELNLDFNIGIIFFSSKLDKMRWINKEEYKKQENWYSKTYSYDLRNNISMTFEEKIIFIEEVLKTMNFNNLSYEEYLIDIIDIIKNIDFDMILKYKNITQIILKKYIEDYNIFNASKDFYNYKYYNYKNYTRDEEIYWSEKSKLDFYDNIVFYIKETKSFIDVFIQYIEKETKFSNKIEYISIINNFKDKHQQKETFNKLFKINDIFRVLNKNYSYEMENALFGKNLDLKKTLSKNINILKIIVDLIYKNKEQMIFFIKNFIKFSLLNNKTKEFILKNYEEFLKNSKDINIINYIYENNLITLEKKDNMFIKLVIEEFIENKSLNKELLNNITNIEDLLNKNFIFLNFKILWLFWKEKDNGINNKIYINSNKIFDLINSNKIEFLSNKNIVKNIIGEINFHGFNNEFETNKKIEFINSFIKYDKSIIIFNELKEMAKIMNITMLSNLEEIFYFTNDNIIEDIIDF